jgi:starch-binding outer membrane protein, SusD/RagB family
MNIKRTMLAIAALTILNTSCEVLDQEPQGSITPALAFVDEKSARNALVGLYDLMQPEGYYGGYFQFTSDNFSDISRFQGFFEGFKEADNKQISALNGNVAAIWGSTYRVINLANEIIAKVPTIQATAFTDQEKAEITGAARCIRALCYLDLLSHFGEHWDINSGFGLPLVEKSTEGDYANVEYPTRSSVKASYDFIRADLEIAKRDLKDGPNRNYATKGFAQGLLARAALFQKDYAKAIEEASAVISNPNYALVLNYEDIFKMANTKESIFELTYLPPLDGSNLALFTLQRSAARSGFDLHF